MDHEPTYGELKQRLAVLEKVSEDLELVYNTVTNSVIVLNADQKIMSVNAATVKLLGLPESELLNRKCYEVLHGEATRPEFCPFQKMFSGDISNNLEAEIELLSGEFLVSCTPVFDNKGQLDRILHVSTNITAIKSNEKKALMLLEATKTIPLSKNFKEAAKSIYDICKEYIGATCGYVAMKSDNEEDNDLLFLDDGGHPCYVDPSLPMPIRGLRKIAYDTGDVACSNDFMNSAHKKYMPKGHMDLNNVLFSPLKFGDDVLGVIGLANKPDGFNKDDIQVAKSFGDVAILALKHSLIKEEIVVKERFSKNLLDQSPNPILVINQDKAVTYANKALERTTGYSLAEVHGLTPPFPWWTKDTLEKTKSDLNKAMKKGAAGVEEKFQTKSGNIFYVEITSIPVMNNGKLDYYIANWIDITNRRELEHELKETIKILKATFQHAPAMITVTSVEDGTYLEVNDAFVEITGYKKKDVIGKTSIGIGLLASSDRNKYMDGLIENGYISNLELNITKVDGSQMVCLYSGVIIGDSHSKRLLSIAIDITDRTRQEELLKEKQSNIEAHSKKLEEMNTALNVLIEHRSEGKEIFKKDMVKQFEKLVFPYFPTSKCTGKEDSLSTILSILERNTKEILMNSDTKNLPLYFGLTPMESHIAQLIKEGKTSKDIANTLKMSVHTVYFHRDNIRKKLDLNKTKTNLKSYLQSHL